MTKVENSESPIPEAEDAPAGQSVRAPKESKSGKRQKTKANKREQSSVTFPYFDLETAVSVARAIIVDGGVPRTRDQLAGAMKQSIRSGSFILKISAARQYGVIDLNQQGKYQLTDLGFALLDKNEGREKSARAQAFLNVPIYRRLYEEFKGRPLPPRPLGLEQTLVHYGVTTKQKAHARLTLEKAARQAGFSTVDPDRLVEPVLGNDWSPTAAPATAVGNPNSQEPQDRQTTVARTASTRFFGGGQPADEELPLDPLVRGLLTRLPKPGQTWSVEKRKRWIQTLEANLEMIYPLTVEAEEPGTDT